MPEPKTSLRPIVEINIRCPECNEIISTDEMDQHEKKSEVELECEWCNLKVKTPAIWVKG